MFQRCNMRFPNGQTSGSTRSSPLSSVAHYFYRFLDSYPEAVDGQILIPVVLVFKQAEVVVDDGEVDNAMRVPWHNFLMHAADEFDPI